MDGFRSIIPELIHQKLDWFSPQSHAPCGNLAQYPAQNDDKDEQDYLVMLKKNTGTSLEAEAGVPTDLLRADEEIMAKHCPTNLWSTLCIPETATEQTVMASACPRCANCYAHGQRPNWACSEVLTRHFNPVLSFLCVFLSFKTDQSAIWKIFITYFVYLQDLFGS